MSGAIGGVGGGGSSAGISSGISAGSAAGGAKSAGSSSGVSATPEAAGNPSAKEISDQGDKGFNSININITNNMSTQNFVEMHNSCSPVNEAQGPDLDIKKLIELMIMMKLLEQLSKSDSGGGGFSAIA